MDAQQRLAEIVRIGQSSRVVIVLDDYAAMPLSVLSVIRDFGAQLQTACRRAELKDIHLDVRMNGDTCK